ncbi:FAD-dependent oxidoreductase [Phenylobacterium montanum]|uniref:FAD-dependent oxidoreductase n=1 Tax=Phenylobacterium montanum TaxID=2823693 RepID=A0A975FZQ6_9CAUL|nr:FAD-dependent oxidoreductase [Caulobacter sp. S6]QUD87892.1 FAD-dependent oxidoreductase [Caulobacter sp. S6]
MRDIHAIDGKFPPPEARYEVVVIGAGPAGIAAALEAARGGAQVLLVDENPVSAGLMGTDAPLFYGQRMTGAVQAKERMVEQVFAASPGLEEAFELGVNVQLGVYAWGAFTGGYGLKSLPEPVVGLADEERSWMVGFDRLIVAAGARDLALSFPGWDQPGVMGANALHALLTRYDAFSGRRLVILGSGQLALETALLALEHGLEVAALVEVRDAVQGREALADKVRAAGVQILTGQVIQRAEGGLDGVERILVAPVADPKTRGQAIECDTVCLAIGLVPAVELLDVLGAPLVADAARGGFVPVLDGAMVQGMAGVCVVGDAAGLDLGHANAHAYQTDWMRALIAAGDPSVIVCQCEEVSREALLAVRQPAYLGPPSNKMADRDIATLAEDGPVNQDQVKRLTRACMGVCQARRCREQVALTLAVATDTPVAQIPLAGYRAPVRPLPLKVLAAWDEAEAMSQGWDVWFGIPTQWTPYADIGTDREARHAEILGGNMHL